MPNNRFASKALLFLVALPAALASAQEDIYEPGIDPGVGFNLVSWFNFGSGGNAVWENAVQSVHDAGFDEVSLSPVRFYQPGSGSIASSSSKGPELSHIAAGITRAKSLGMRVTVNPFVEPVNFTGWRGHYNPSPGSSESNTFWSDYQQYVGDVATMAQANGADSMTIGTELRNLVRNTGNNAHWSQLIDTVDSSFTGSIGYAANWDNYNHSNIDNAIWDHEEIDFIGIDAYFPNTVSNSEADSSGAFGNETFINAARDGWNQRLDNQILPYASARQGGSGLAVELTEVGYLPYNRTGVNPQNGSGSLDPSEQNMMFAGLMRALDGRLDEDGLLAAHIWQWDMPGSSGSQWNLNPNGGDQPNNQQTAQWLSNFVSNPAMPSEPGDFDNDGDVDLDDLDQYNGNIGATTTDNADLEALDLDGDGTVGANDFARHYGELVETSNGGKGTAQGDVNLDGVVDVLNDAVILVSNLGTEQTSWGAADLDASGNVDVLADAAALVGNLGTNNGGGAAPATSAVPEPGTVFLLILASSGVTLRRRL